MRTSSQTRHTQHQRRRPQLPPPPCRIRLRHQQQRQRGGRGLLHRTWRDTASTCGEPRSTSHTRFRVFDRWEKKLAQHMRKSVVNTLSALNLVPVSLPSSVHSSLGTLRKKAVGLPPPPPRTHAFCFFSFLHYFLLFLSAHRGFVPAFHLKPPRGKLPSRAAPH